MGVLPLQYQPGESAASLGLTGHETFDIRGIEEINSGKIPNEVVVTADGREFRAKVRIDTPGEADYYRHGGIMQYVLRSLLPGSGLPGSGLPGSGLPGSGLPGSGHNAS
jgi:aconitate hydratase